MLGYGMSILLAGFWEVCMREGYQGGGHIECAAWLEKAGHGKAPSPLSRARPDSERSCK